MKKKLINGSSWPLGNLPKIYRTMKLMCFFMFVVLLQVSASSYSQTKKLTLEGENLSLEEVFELIEAQSEFSFLYNLKQVDLSNRVDVDFRNKSVESILTNILVGSNITYTVDNRLIIIHKESEVDIENSWIQFQQNEVSGKVTDGVGKPLPGVTVVVKGTTQGTVTNADGEYSLSNIQEDATLVFSFVGMRTQEIVFKAQTTINVTMEVDAIGIEEVVAIGYGSLRKADITGAVSSANLESFSATSNVNILQSMQGTVPGLNIGQVDEAGEQPSISIRGRNTISGNTSPLIVLDGIIYYGSLSELNPGDIKSIDILKDASSKAIYGAYAANGVVLVTTKKGVHETKPIINYSVSYSTQNPSHVLKLLDRDGFIQKVKDVDWRNAYTASSNYTQENSSYNLLTSTSLVDQDNFDGYNNGTNFDWWDAATNPGHIQEHQLSVHGANEKFHYYMSVGYTDQKNFIVNDLFKRVSSRMNLETIINPWLKVGAQSSGSFSDYSGASPSLSGISYAGPLRTPYDSDGNLKYSFYSSAVNPFTASEADDYDIRNSLIGNLYSIIDFPFIKGLSYQVNFGNNYRWTQANSSNVYGATQTGLAGKASHIYYDLTFDNIVSFKKNQGKQVVDITFVAGLGKRTHQYTQSHGTGFTDLTLSYNSLQQAINQYIYSSAWEESMAYQMGRINYSYDGKYLLTATVRRDGFSGFAADEKIALFPSVALGWVASSESFFSNINWANYLKIRGSYGKNGNVINRYASLAEVTSSLSYVFGDGGTPMLGQAPASLGNTKLKWETTSGVNLGLDFGLLKNRIRGNFEYYMSRTNDLLFGVSIPYINGASSIISNVGEIENRGGEFSITGDILKTKELLWSLTFNYSKNLNKIVKLAGEDSDGDGIEDDLISSGLFIGKSLGAIYDYQTDGFWQIGDNIPAGWSEGTEKIVDQNNDGFYTAEKDRVIIGKKEPAYMFSVQNQIEYKGFELMIFINSIQGGKNGYLGANNPWSNSIIENAIGAKRYNFYSDINYWTPNNVNAEYRMPGNTGAIKPGIYKDRSFIRLQDVSLSYNFKKGFINDVGIGNLKLYVSGKNLYTWTKWKGWDPETGYGYDFNGRPVMRNYTIGLVITL